MNIRKNNFVKSRNDNISVVWEQGNVKGFNSKEAAQLYIERVCKKTAPELEYSVSCFSS
jgi:hypothetical protein